MLESQNYYQMMRYIYYVTYYVAVLNRIGQVQTIIAGHRQAYSYCDAPLMNQCAFTVMFVGCMSGTGSTLVTKAIHAMIADDCDEVWWLYLSADCLYASCQ